MKPAEIIEELLGLAELVVSKVVEHDDFEGWRHAVHFVGSDGEGDAISVSPETAGLIALAVSEDWAAVHERLAAL